MKNIFNISSKAKWILVFILPIATLASSIFIAFGQPSFRYVIAPSLVFWFLLVVDQFITFSKKNGGKSFNRRFFVEIFLMLWLAFGSFLYYFSWLTTDGCVMGVCV